MFSPKNFVFKDSVRTAL